MSDIVINYKRCVIVVLIVSELGTHIHKPEQILVPTLGNTDSKGCSTDSLVGVYEIKETY
jgi:hypothetical protein